MKIVIVGGGVAGIEIATGLARQKRFAVTLVDKTLSHVWKPMLHGFAAGTARPDREKVDFLAHAKRYGYQFIPGALAKVDREAHTITLDALVPNHARSASIPYDALILALGSRANDFGTKGVSEHCCFIDDLEQATCFHSKLRTYLFRSVEDTTDMRIAIVGGGATGVELAAELKRAMDIATGYASPALADKLQLSLLEAGPRLLPPFPASVSNGASATLLGLGVDVRTETHVVEADSDGFVLGDGSRVDAGLMVWAAGVKAPEAIAQIPDLERDKSAKLVIRSSLQTTRDEAIFAVGDCASLMDEQTKKPVPATAQAARQQARHLVKHLARWSREGVMKPYTYREKGALVSLADYNGWGTLGSVAFGGGRFRGFSARTAHRALYRQHKFEVHGIEQGLVMWLADILDRSVSPRVRLD